MSIGVRVLKIEQLTPRIKSFALARPDGVALPAFTAGAHVEVDVRVGEQLQTRAYSLFGMPSEPAVWHIAVLRETQGSGGSAYMHDRVSVGDILTVSEPKNDFPLAETASHHVLVAGGIGVTPILAMARHLAESKQSFEVHYCGRSLDDLALIDALREAAGKQLSLYLDAGNPLQGLSLGSLFEAKDPGRHLYVCGPAGMIAAAIDLRGKTEYPAAALHIELFTPAAAVEGDRPVTLELAKSGRVIEAGSNTTILEALLAAGVEAPYDCKRGECGICAVPVLSGDVIHRDFVLGEWERGEGRLMCICISRASSSTLVLDL
jgi:ferredoxin-NADP reductase